MKIVKNPKNKYIIFLTFLIFNSFLFSLNVESSLNKVLKDSLIDIGNIDSKDFNKPEYLFMSALVESNGETAVNKLKDFYNKFPSNSYADNAIFEVGSYFYTKGYYVKSSQWYKKIPIYYHDSELLDQSIDMFFKALEISNFKDSIKYYKNIFSKLYPIVEDKKIIKEYKSALDNKEKIYNQKYVIQIGAFKEYPRAESRLYMLRDIGFGVVIEETTINNEPFFVIREGIYSTKKSAEKIASRIQARTGIKCMIIEL